MRETRKRFTPEARRLIRKLPPEAKRPLRALTDEIATNPLMGKELQKELRAFRSARYSHYRVIYEHDPEKGWVTIHFVGKRENVYELFTKLVGLEKLPKVVERLRS